MKEQQARKEAERITREYPSIDARATQPAGNAWYVDLTLRAKNLHWSCLWPKSIYDALEAWACFLEDEHQVGA